MRLEKWRNKKTKAEFYILVELQGSYLSGGRFIYHNGGKPNPEENEKLWDYPAYQHPEGLKLMKHLGLIS